MRIFRPVLPVLFIALFLACPGSFPAQGSPSAAPALHSIAPNRIYNHQEIHLAIRGAGFQPGAAIFLGEQPLENVFFLSSSDLTALVPAGLPVGFYSLEVSNPDGARAEMPAALEVVTSGGGWVSGGPFGEQALQPRALSASPAGPGQLYTAAGSAGGYASRSGGLDWQAAQVLPTQVLAAAASPHLPCTGYLGGMGWVFKTTSCGEHWTSTPLPNSGSGASKTMALAVDPLDSNSVYAGGLRSPAGLSSPNTGFLYLSPNGGTSWMEITLALPGAPISQVAAIAFGPAPGRIYVATGGWSGGGILSTTGYLYTSADGGIHWKRLSVEDTHKPLAALAVDGSRDGHLYASLVQQIPGQVPYGAIYESFDFGETWRMLAIPAAMREGGINALAFDPFDSTILYAGSAQNGLFRSLDGGASWSPDLSALGQLGINCLEAQKASSDPQKKTTLLYACSTGGASPASNAGETEPSATQLQGGIYQRTLNWQKMYFPVVNHMVGSP